MRKDDCTMNCTVIGKSVQGASHIVHNTECQDSYRQVQFDDGCAIVAVADGHGSSSCPFSKSGSTIAVNTFIHIISELHDLYADKLDALSTYLNREGEVKIAQTIDLEWKKRVLKAHSTDYDRVKDNDGNYKSVFSGYVCNHRLKVEFDFDTKRLAQTLYAISKCLALPELSISFTVKDPTAVNSELLRSATINAKEKAKILCDASGVELGELLSIDYNWGELNIVSHTDYMLEEKCLAMPSSSLADIDIEPDDIDVRDTATFIWEIK